MSYLISLCKLITTKVMQNSIFLLVSLMLVSYTNFSYAHSNHKKKEKVKDKKIEKTITEVESEEDDDEEKSTKSISYTEEDENLLQQSLPGKEIEVPAPLEAFPNLHPLIVHVTVVTIPFALILSAIALLWKNARNVLMVVNLLLLASGTISGYLAGELFHPHTAELPEPANTVLELHEYYAEQTIIFSALALIATALVLVFRKGKWHLTLIGVSLVFSLVASYMVTQTGHLGAQLVHIHNVGPAGKWLE